MEEVWETLEFSAATTFGNKMAVNGWNASPINIDIFGVGINIGLSGTS